MRANLLVLGGLAFALFAAAAPPAGALSAEACVWVGSGSTCVAQHLEPDPLLVDLGCQAFSTTGPDAVSVTVCLL